MHVLESVVKLTRYIIYIILCRPKVKMSKCPKCFVRYCTAECSTADWQKHKPFCKTVVEFLARYPMQNGSRKARKHSQSMRSSMMKRGMGFGFIDEATYIEKCHALGMECEWNEHAMQYILQRSTCTSAAICHDRNTASYILVGNMYRLKYWY